MLHNTRTLKKEKLMKKTYIEPRHNLTLSYTSLLFSILIAPIGIILSIVSLVRIAKNRLDETIDKQDKKSQLISVISLIIGVVLTVTISVLSFTGNAPWQIMEAEQQPQQITEVVDKNIDSVINLSDENRALLTETLESSYTEHNIDIEKLGVSGNDILNWIIGGITYTTSEPSIDGDSASIDVNIHHRNTSDFTSDYAKALSDELKKEKTPTTKKMGNIMKELMENTPFVDEDITLNLTKENGSWQLTQESNTELAKLLFNTGTSS